MSSFDIAGMSRLPGGTKLVLYQTPLCLWRDVPGGSITTGVWSVRA
jgi:hypothetical protein